jgi:YYY domain-containing protein
LGPFFVLIVSNLEGFLEMMHAKGFFWQKDQNGLLQSKFWSWLNIQELNQPPLMPYSFNPNRSGGIWWWRASRVLQDFDITGISKEVIDEFPFFSYFLGDLHPHVLAMPLGLLAISIGLNLFRGIKKYQQNTSFNKWIKEPILWFTILCCGGIAFTNTWDLPIYLGIISSVFLMIRIKGAGWSLLRIWETLKLILIIGILSILVYLPFFIGFSSQAGGILPSLNFFTPGKNFWIMFFPFLTILVFFLGWLLLHKENLKELPKTAIYCGICVSLLAIISYGFAWLIGNFSDIVLFIERITSRNGPPVFTSINSLVNLFIGVHGGMPINDVITTSLKNRISSPMTLLTLLFIGIICFSYFLSLFDKQGHKGKMSRIADESLGLFPIILLIFVGTIFCLIPEFFYLRDVFATRMNTIFKFYFQSWTIWGVAVAAAAIILWRQLREKSRVVFSFVLICAILTCCAYPFFGLIDKFKGIDLKDLTLDGSYYLFKYNNDEYNAIQWLRNTKYGNVAEAIGGSYSGYARIATYSGLPAVLGWPGHEMQWRGGVKEMESRESDIQLLYETDDWLKADEIIQKYQIRYIYVGNLEKSKYAVELNKFTEKLIKVYSNDTVLIYESNLE